MEDIVCATIVLDGEVLCGAYYGSERYNELPSATKLDSATIIRVPKEVADTIFMGRVLIGDDWITRLLTQ